MVRINKPSLKKYQALLNVAENLDAEWEALLAEASSAGIKAAELKTLLEMMKKRGRLVFPQST